MSSSAQSDKDRFQRELEHFRSLAKQNKRALEGKPILTVQLNFWFESFRFLITELEIWNYAGNQTKYAETVSKIEKVLHHIHRLVVYLDDEEDANPEL